MNFFSLLFLISYIGFINFLKSCTLPFCVGFFIFFLSLMFWHLAVGRKKKFWSIMRYAFLFGLGFVLIFVAKAATITAIGQSLTMRSTFYTAVGGLIMIILGLAMLPYAFSKKLKLSRWAGISSLVAGGTFALSWQPCSKVVIPAFQEFASKQNSLGAGIFFLTLIGLGIVIPLLILSAPLVMIIKYIKIPASFIRIMQIIDGSLLVILGILFLTGNIDIFFSWVGAAQGIITR